MKKLFKMMTLVLVALACFTLLVGCGNNKNYAANNDKIFIGVSGPLTGDAASYGLAVKNSAQLAVDEINAKGGLNGVLFEFEAIDDELLADKASVNFSSLFEKGMQISLGAVTSGACLEFGPLANDEKVFSLTPSATNDTVPTTGVYQMCFSDSGQGIAAAQYIDEYYKDAKIGIFYDSSDDYSKGIYDNFKKTFSRDTVDASFTKDTNTDFSSQVQTLKNCDFIFMPIYYTQAALFIQQAKGVLADNAVYFGCDGLDGIESVEGFNPYDYTQEISYLSHFNPGQDNEKVQHFVTEYTKKYGKETLNQFGAAAYDCVYAIYNALLNSGKEVKANASPADLYDILTGVFNNGFTFDGVTGTGIKWNSDKTVSKVPTKYVVNGNK